MLLLNKDEATYDTSFRKLLELEPALNPVSIMTDFENASINAFENNYISVINGCFFHLSQNVYRKVQVEGLSQNYQESPEFALKMLPSLAFVPEMEVVDCFNLLMQLIWPNISKIITLAKSYQMELEEYHYFQSGYGTYSQEFKNIKLAQTTALRDGTMAFKHPYHVPTSMSKLLSSL